MATAIVVIGYGATELSGRRGIHHSRSDHPLAGVLPLVNLLVYVALAGLAIASQWDLALRSAAGRLGPLLVLDHALAIGLLVALTWRIASRVIADDSIGM